jgi:hypothetical protein
MGKSAKKLDILHSQFQAIKNKQYKNAQAIDNPHGILVFQSDSNRTNSTSLVEDSKTLFGPSFGFAKN